MGLTLDELLHQLRQLRSRAEHAGETETYVERVSLDDDGHVVVTKKSDRRKPGPYTPRKTETK